MKVQSHTPKSHHLKLRAAVSPGDFMKVRAIRNECRRFMTRDDREIGVLKQIRFWLANLKQNSSTRVYLGTCCDQPVAYGIIRDGHVLSGGITRNHRGLGLGKRLFGFLAIVCPPGCTPTLEVYKLNKAALLTYQSLGFKAYGTDPSDKIYYMRFEHDDTAPRRRASRKTSPRSPASRKTSQEKKPRP